jgi:hypothetical protein
MPVGGPRRARQAAGARSGDGKVNKHHDVQQRLDAAVANRPHCPWRGKCRVPSQGERCEEYGLGRREAFVTNVVAKGLTKHGVDVIVYDPVASPSAIVRVS